MRRASLEAQAARERYQVALDALQPESDRAGAVPTELKGLERQFLEGNVEISRVVQARNSIIQDQRSQLDLYNELAQAAANLVEASGIPVEEVVWMGH